MITISYTISSQIKQFLTEIEAVRREVLLTPLSREQEATLSYEATLETLRYFLSLNHMQMRKSEIHHVLSIAFLQRRKKTGLDLTQLLLYKKSLDYISAEWHVSAKKVRENHIQELATGIRMKNTRGLSDLLDYLQVNHDSPIIQAGIATTTLASLDLFGKQNEVAGMLTGKLFLSKSGYNCRDFVSLERQYKLSPGAFFNAYQNGIRNTNQTIWLEYYTAAYLEELKLLRNHIALLRHHAGWEDPLPANQDAPSIKELGSAIPLTKRQKAILTLFIAQDTTVTNRDVQKQFGISQITASRDLAYLRTYGFVFSHGNGRSVYYTKV